jgi:hypothetical protein
MPYTPCPRCGQALELSPGAEDEIKAAVEKQRAHLLFLYRTNIRAFEQVLAWKRGPRP